MKLAVLMLPVLLLVGCATTPVLYEGQVDEAALKAPKSFWVKPIKYEAELADDCPVGRSEWLEEQAQCQKEFVSRLQQSEGKPFNTDEGEAVLELTVQLVDFGEASFTDTRPARIQGFLTLSRGGSEIYRANFQGQVHTGASTWRTRIEAAHRDVARALAERIGNSFP